MRIHRKGMNGTSEFIIPGFVGIMVFVIVPLVDVFRNREQKTLLVCKIMHWSWRMMHSGWQQATLCILNL